MLKKGKRYKKDVKFFWQTDKYFWQVERRKVPFLADRQTFLAV